MRGQVPAADRGGRPLRGPLAWRAVAGPSRFYRNGRMAAFAGAARVQSWRRLRRGVRAPADRSGLMRQGPYGPPPSPSTTEVYPLPPPVTIAPEQPRTPPGQYGSAPIPDSQASAQPGYSAPPD